MKKIVLSIFAAIFLLGMAAAGETQSSDTTPVIVKIKTPNPNVPRGGADVPINAVLNDATMTYTAYYSFDFGLVNIDVSCDGVLVGSAIKSLILLTDIQI